MAYRGSEPTASETQTLVREWLAAHLKDPDSLKQFEIISGPDPVQWYRGLVNGGGNEQGWLVCFRYNAKNSYGAYVGAQVDGVVIRGGSVLGGARYLMADRTC
jgi:hypothetical protein